MILINEARICGRLIQEATRSKDIKIAWNVIADLGIGRRWRGEETRITKTETVLIYEEYLSIYCVLDHVTIYAFCSPGRKPAQKHKWSWQKIVI